MIRDIVAEGIQWLHPHENQDTDPLLAESQSS
jgi:hypothetical protein